MPDSIKQSGTRRGAPGQDRGEETRRRLIAAAVELFGHHGYAGVTTRKLVDKAGANQVAIPYHFGGKQGLYIAVAEHIVAQLAAQTAPVVGELRTQLKKGPPDKQTAARLLRDLMHRIAALIVGSPEAEHWARFIIREQMDPSPAFEILYRGMYGNMLRAITRLLAIALDADEGDEEIRIRAFALGGQIMIFRTARAAVLRRLDWDEVGARELAAIQAVIDAHVDAILAAGKP